MNVTIKQREDTKLLILEPVPDSAVITVAFNSISSVDLLPHMVPKVLRSLAPIPDKPTYIDVVAPQFTTSLDIKAMVAEVEASQLPTRIRATDQRRATSTTREPSGDLVFFGLIAATVAIPLGIVGTLVYAAWPVISAVCAVVEFVATVAGDLPAVGIILAMALLTGMLTQWVRATVGGVTSAPMVGGFTVPASPMATPAKRKIATIAEEGSRLAIEKMTHQTVMTKQLSGREIKIQDRTDRWLADMRNPNHSQTTETYYGGKNCRCARGWLMYPKNGPEMSWRDTNHFYGKRFMSKVEGMNQEGIPLPKIADYVEKKLGR